MSTSMRQFRTEPALDQRFAAFAQRAFAATTLLISTDHASIAVTIIPPCSVQ